MPFRNMYIQIFQCKNEIFCTCNFLFGGATNQHKIIMWILLTVYKYCYAMNCQQKILFDRKYEYEAWDRRNTTK